MCGINGIISNYDSHKTLVKNMNSSIYHRGPDCQKEWTSGSTTLGHTRLSIIDLSESGNQPFSKADLVIVFNGEIYNYKELRAQLSGNRVFNTDSDTEVVLEAWKQWGSSCLKKLRGMFSFAIHDKSINETWIVRDPFGIKPLFYYPLTNGGLAFSSELKALEQVFINQLTLNQNAVAAALLYVWVPENTAIWNEVKKLGPGCLLHVNRQHQITEHRYWHSSSVLRTHDSLLSNEAEATEALQETLLDSVKSHLVADVPINAFLSGGLDSSLLVAMARSQLDELDCYTIRFSDSAKKAEAMADDAHYAKIAANKLGVKLHTIDVEPDLAALLPKIVHHLDEPIGDSAAINTYLICQAAHEQGVKVLLSGMGADELFGGYRKHYANLVAQRYRKTPSILRTPFEALINSLPVNIRGHGIKPVRWAKRFLSFAGLPEDDAFFRSYTYYDRDSFAELLPQFGANSFDEIRSQHHSVFNSAAGHHILDKMCYTDLNLFMVSLNETYTDRASMAASTEVRVPFIDKEVVDLAFRIDPRLKIKGRTGKYILKKAAEKWLPNEIIYRPKSPFTLPLRSWIRGQLVDMVDDLVLSGNGLAGREWFSERAIRKLVLDDRSGKADNAQHIWQLLTLEQWFRNHRI